jgi:hypothetical protein
MKIDILLLLALPASGKSELRRYIASLDAETAMHDLWMGPAVQLDDYPYVHLMRRIAEEVGEADGPPTFFASADEPFADPRDWGTLTHLLNMDFEDLVDPPRPLRTGTATRWLFERLDRARELAGMAPAVADLPPLVLKRLTNALEHEAQTLFDEKAAAIPDNLEDKTIIIEFARGGPEGSRLPLPAPYGYQYSLPMLSDEILDRAAILYVWVEPEESRRKNVERAQPGRTGAASILHHGVPEAVMRSDYGTDDLMWLLAQGGGSYVIVEKDTASYGLPTGVFDNRKDLTTFLRSDPSRWSPIDLRRLHRELVDSTAGLRTRV